MGALIVRLVVLRHGQTDLNKNYFYNGQTEEDINEEGIKQAKEAAKTLSESNFNKIYCSPLKRTKHTCEIVNLKKQEVIYDDRIKERTLGEYDGKSLRDTKYNLDMHNHYYYKQVGKGLENLPELFQRVHNFLDDVISSNNKDDTILIVTHGGVMRAIYFYFEEMPEDGDLSFYQAKNCEINIYEIL